jgi:hypothetical protein
VKKPTPHTTPETKSLVSGNPVAKTTQAQESDSMIEPLRLRVLKAAAALDVSPRHLKYRIDSGELASLRDGKARFVLTAVLKKYAKIDRPNSPRKPSPKRLRKPQIL